MGIQQAHQTVSLSSLKQLYHSPNFQMQSILLPDFYPTKRIGNYSPATFVIRLTFIETILYVIVPHLPGLRISSKISVCNFCLSVSLSVLLVLQRDQSASFANFQISSKISSVSSVGWVCPTCLHIRHLSPYSSLIHLLQGSSFIASPIDPLIPFIHATQISTILPCLLNNSLKNVWRTPN